jgi:predicted NBD/HSP70 family sugar kinase
VLANRAFVQAAESDGAGVPLVFGLERANGVRSRFETRVFSAGHPQAAANIGYAERLLKFLLWQRGAWRLYVGGPAELGQRLAAAYAPGGERAFDAEFLGEQVYRRPFTVVPCAAKAVPAAREREQALGRHLDGYRIGFDLGASDVKVSAVVDGQVIYSQEIIWEPTVQTDPGYHYDLLTSAIRIAAARMPRVDAIGGSAAGIYVDNQPRVASIFRGIPQERFDEVRVLFARIRDEWGVPFRVWNDGDVAALAGSMALGRDAVLGIALGSSEAAGYITRRGNVTGWLNELGFCPIDYSPGAVVEAWSGDRGVGSRYLSQQAVFRLAPQAGIALATGMAKAEQLESIQVQLEAGHDGAVQIWQSVGVYLGYALAHYAQFYDLEHVLLMGRCTSGIGGPLILESANRVLQTEFPAIAGRIDLNLPGEETRRVGQAIAAASLPAIL